MTRPLETIFAVVVGREKEMAAIIAAVNCGRHILIEGPPGTSKSTVLRTIAKYLGMPLFIVEGNMDLTPAKLAGHFNPGKVMQDSYDPKHFEKGPLTMAMEQGGILYIEEFNRMPADVANILITPMEERELNIPRYGKVVAQGKFTVVASQNPYDDVGTVRISRAFMDRICRITLDYQSEAEELEIVSRRTGSTDEKLMLWAVKLARRTRKHEEIKMGASVRAAIDLVALGESMKKKGLLTAENVEQAALMALSSKVWLTEMSNKTPEQVVSSLVREMKEEENLSYVPVTEAEVGAEEKKTFHQGPEIPSNNLRR